MLDSLYTSFFRPSYDQFSPQVAIAITALALVVLAFNAAGAVGTGLLGVIGFFLLFLLAGVLGWYWLSASLHLLAQAMGGQGRSQITLMATAQALWPLILTAPAIAASRWSFLLGALFSLAINIGVIITLTSSIHYAHQLNWLKALLSVVITLGLSTMALLGLLLWPVMIILGM